MLPNPQDQQLADASQKMLKRTTLTGADVPVFVQIHNWLEAIREGRLIVIQPVPTELQPEPAVAPAAEATMDAVGPATVAEEGVNEKAPDAAPQVEAAPTPAQGSKPGK